MKLKTNLNFNSLALITLAGFFANGGGVASAATRTWDGASGGDWNAAINWSADTTPVAGDTAVFNTTLAAVVNAVADQSVLNLHFDGAAGTASGTMTVGTTAGNSLIVGNGGATEILSSLTGTAKVISIDAPIVLTPASTTADGSYSLINNSTDATNGLKFTGTIQASTTSGTETLVLSGGNTGESNVITGAISNGGASALAVHKTGLGKWTINSSANPYNDPYYIINIKNNSYSGGTTISGGMLEVYSVYTQSPLGTGLLTFDGGTLQGAGYIPILMNDIVVNDVAGNAVSTPADTQLRGTITGSGTLTHQLDSYAALGLFGNNSGFTGTYVQDANGSYGWTYFYDTASGSANASWVVNNRGLAGNMGTTTIHLGSLASTNASAEIGNHGGGSLTFVLGENNASTTYGGLVLDLSGPSAMAGGTTAIVKEGSGTLLLTNRWNNYSGGTTINGGTLGYDLSLGWTTTFGTGPITLNGGTLLADTHSALANAIVVNGVAGNGINLGNDGSNFTGNFSGSGDVTFTATGGAWVTLSGDNSGYSGTMTGDPSISGNFQFGTSESSSDKASWVFNNAGVIGGNSGSGSQTLNFGSLAGTNPNTQLGDGYNSSTLVKIGAKNESTDYAGKIMDAWYGSGTTRVTKVGTGTQTLSGALTYKGNTTIEDGVLSIISPNFDDASTVTIGTVADSPAVLDLPNAGTDIVGALVIDGVAQATGKVYGNSDSVLPVVATTAITGPGRIQVGAVPAYDTWLIGNPSLTGANQLPTADPDNDGLINQQEFAFGLIPDNGSSVDPIISQLDKTTGTFTYQRRASTGLTYRILTSPDLSTWSEDVTATASQIAGAVDGNGNQSVVVTLTGTKPLTDSKKFVRVAAE